MIVSTVADDNADELGATHNLVGSSRGIVLLAETNGLELSHHVQIEHEVEEKGESTRAHPDTIQLPQVLPRTHLDLGVAVEDLDQLQAHQDDQGDKSDRDKHRLEQCRPQVGSKCSLDHFFFFEEYLQIDFSIESKKRGHYLEL